ncbi:Pesticin receptor [Zhongshania aliphaticivorans]|uniref:Pesticin receptor n=2 Tax=Zhongshania aliphaticivorans TaxID=1470434 RepID=A0A5S9NPJ6_9GAMM|nr:Pesticin receptor [Zhongshania aliphaticivorans]CAA0109618.1 Pesticin receptor [Zhongshania aliphaticivorans]
MTLYQFKQFPALAHRYSECTFKPLLLSVTLVGVLLPSSVALAAEAGRLEEILVSARKKTESLQDTPISLTVFNEERLVVEGISGLKDIANKVPGLTIEPFPINGGSLRIYIRGIGIGDIQVTQDTPVALYMDGVYIARSSGTSMDVAELARIEVLRGPQGTLYGRNTTGGAINLITKRPNTEALEFSQVVSAGNRNLLRSKTSLNVPITDTLALKFAYLTESRDGFVENTGPGGDFGDRDIQGARFDLGWDISDRLRLDYSYDRSELEFYNYMFQSVMPPDPEGSKGQSEAIKNSAQERSRFDEDMLTSLATTAPMEASTSDVEGHALILSASTDLGDIKYIASYRELVDAAYTDLGGGLGAADYRLDTNAYDGPAALYATGGATPLVRPEIRQRQSSHELQFNGAAEDWGIEYLIGGYYFEETATEDNSPLHLQLRAPLDGADGVYLVNLLSQLYKVDNEALAVFGQLTWTPAILDEALHITLGARHSRDKRYALKNQEDEVLIEYSPISGIPIAVPLSLIAENPLLAPLVNPILAEVGLPGDRRFNNVSGSRRFKDDSFSLLAEYELSDEANLYAKMVEAYKSGGFNTRDPQLDGNQGAASDDIDYGVGFADGFGEEKARTVEVGVKSEWLKGRVRVNADIYHTEFDDMQMNFLLNGTVADTKVLNAGKASMSGFEFDATALLGDDFIIAMEYAYLDAEITEVIDSYGNNVTQRYAFSAAPKNTYTASLDWVMWRSDFAVVQLNVNTSYMDTRLGGGDVQDAYTILRDYQLWNARLSVNEIELGKGAVSIAFWGKNLLDETYEIYAIDNLPHADRAVLWGDPVSYGVDMAYRF